MEGGRVFDELTVDDNLAAGAIVRRDRRAMPSRRDEIHDLFPVLRDRRHNQAGYLSGGERQMLAIGRALMSDPTLLLLDEPSLGLAPIVAEQIRDIVVEIAQRGATVLLVEQNASMALAISDRAYILQTGRRRHERALRRAPERPAGPGPVSGHESRWHPDLLSRRTP